MSFSAVLALAERLTRHLAEIDGVIAVVLGGSWARGTAHAESDIDLGIYYQPQNPPSLERLRDLAQRLDDRHLPTLITNFGEWGPWINGGGWLEINGRHVDWLFRDLDRVDRSLDDCCAGRPTCDYQIGHPHGFHNHIYMGETHHCRILHDPTGVLAALQARTIPYPPALKRTLIDRYLFEAHFSLFIARKGLPRTDVAYVAGCLFRCGACLIQVLLALNERYFLNEKGVVALVDSLPLHPANFADTVARVHGHHGTTTAELEESIERLAALTQAVQVLCPQ